MQAVTRVHLTWLMVAYWPFPVWFVLAIVFAAMPWLRPSVWIGLAGDGYYGDLAVLAFVGLVITHSTERRVFKRIVLPHVRLGGLCCPACDHVFTPGIDRCTECGRERTGRERRMWMRVRRRSKRLPRRAK